MSHHANYYFAQMIRQMAEEAVVSRPSERSRIINKNKMGSLINHIAVHINVPYTEMDERLNISKRTLSKFTETKTDMMISMNRNTIDNIIEYVYEIAEIYEAVV